jgi:hypothetical protein
MIRERIFVRNFFCALLLFMAFSEFLFLFHHLGLSYLFRPYCTIHWIISMEEQCNVVVALILTDWLVNVSVCVCG